LKNNKLKKLSKVIYQVNPTASAKRVTHWYIAIRRNGRFDPKQTSPLLKSRQAASVDQASPVRPELVPLPLLLMPDIRASC